MLFMILCMLISVRSEWLNRVSGGLDKAYIIHKWAGIFALVFAVLHWSIEKIPHFLVELEIIPNPGELTDGSQFAEYQVVMFQIGTTIAEFFVYVFIALIVIALVTRIPYRYFRITHKIFPAIFLLLAWHAGTAQLKERWLETPAGYLLLLVLAIGSAAAIIALFQRIGRKKKVKATIQRIESHSHVIDVCLRIDSDIKYKAGQYAFLKFEHSSEPHPFSIASSDTQTMRFAIKKLGDFTNSLNEQIKVDQTVIVEGPYGEFTFEDNCEEQVWIAGGIGITPFLGRLEHLASTGGSKKNIHLWYCTRGELSLQFPSSLPGLCNKAGVTLHHLNSSKKEYFSSQGHIGNDASVWFCGPAEFRKCVRDDLTRDGFDLRRFHYDSFNMR